MDMTKRNLPRAFGSRHVPEQQRDNSDLQRRGNAHQQLAMAVQTKSLPVAPPVYRPQPLPQVLQTKVTSRQFSQTGQPPRRPVAPPVYRPEPKRFVQPKMAAASQEPNHPNAQPVYRPKPGRIIQPKLAAAARTLKISNASSVAIRATLAIQQKPHQNQPHKLSASIPKRFVDMVAHSRIVKPEKAPNLQANSCIQRAEDDIGFALEMRMSGELENRPPMPETAFPLRFVRKSQEFVESLGTGVSSISTMSGFQGDDERRLLTSKFKYTFSQMFLAFKKPKSTLKIVESVLRKEAQRQEIDDSSDNITHLTKGLFQDHLIGMVISFGVYFSTIGKLSNPPTNSIVKKHISPQLDFLPRGYKPIAEKLAKFGVKRFVSPVVGFPLSAVEVAGAVGTIINDSEDIAKSHPILYRELRDNQLESLAGLLKPALDEMARQKKDLKRITVLHDE